MLDSLSKYVIEKKGYRCFGKAKSSDSCLYKDLTDITDFPSKIYFSTMNNLQFYFRKEDCKEFGIILLYDGYGITFEGCNLLNGFSSSYRFNRITKKFEEAPIKTSGSFSSSVYYGLTKNFTNEEILEIIENPKEMYFDNNGNIITKEEYGKDL